MVNRKTLEAFYRGESWASRAIFERYQELVYFALSTVLKEKRDIDEAYQETFFTLLKNKPAFRDDGMGLPTYLIKSAKTVATDMARRSNQLCLVNVEKKTEVQPRTGGYIVMKYLSPPLSELEGQIVAYKAAFSLSFREISEIVGISETTTRRIYGKGIKRIRKECKHDRERGIRSEILGEIKTTIPDLGFPKAAPQRKKSLVPAIVFVFCLLGAAAAIPTAIYLTNAPKGGSVATIRVLHMGDTCVGELGQRITLKSYEIPDGSHITITVDLFAESYSPATMSGISLDFEPRGDDSQYGKVFCCDFDSDAFAALNSGNDPQKKEIYAGEIAIPFRFDAEGYSLLDEDLWRIEFTFGFTDPQYHRSLYLIIDKTETRG